MQKYVEKIHKEEQEHVKEVSLCITQNNITVSSVKYLHMALKAM